MASSHTTWLAQADKSNKKEQTRVSKKYKGVKKAMGAFTEKDMNADPFQENDPIVDTMDIGRTHKLDQYARAAGLPQAKAKKILEETETLQK